MRTKRYCYIQMVVALVMLAVLCGCDQSQTSQCEQDKLQLQRAIESQQAQIEQMKQNEEITNDIMMDITGRLEKTQKELTKARKAKLPKRRKPGKITPEQSQRLIKGMEELKALREAKIKRMKEQSDQ